MSSGNSDQYPVAHGGYVAWANVPANGRTTFTLYNAATGAYTLVTPPSNVLPVGNFTFDYAFDFAPIAGNINLFYFGQTSGNATPSNRDVFQWLSSTQSSTALTASGALIFNPVTDGARVAWSQVATGGLAPPSTLVTQPVSGGTRTIVSTNMESFLLADSVLTWGSKTSEKGS
jgi:hypothetical protein